MIGVCGWVGYLQNKESSTQLLKEMSGAVAFDRSSKKAVFVNERFAIAAQILTGNIIYHESDDCIVIFQGQPAWTDSVLNERSRRGSLAKIFLEEYPQHGSELLKKLCGSFSLVYLSKNNNEALIAVDHIASCPLAYAFVKDCLIFSSNEGVLSTHPLVEKQIDPQALYNYIYFHAVPKPGTIYVDQKHLLPGHYLHLKNKRIEITRYWQLAYSHEYDRPSIKQYKPQLLALVQNAVELESDTDNIGAFLSGGVDSSTISGFLGKYMDKPARAYSIGFDAEGYDEMEYARLVAKHFGMAHHEYYVTPQDVVDVIPKIAKAYGQPFGNSSAVAVYYCAVMAKSDGVEKLLAGDGGDELFGGNYRYAKQNMFSLFSDLPSPIRKLCIEPLVFAVPGGDKLLPLRKLRSYIKQASVPMPERLETYNFLHRLGTKNIFNPEFFASIDDSSPLALLTEVYDGSNAKSMLNKILDVDFKFTLADNDLPKVNTMCHMAGVDVSFPLLNDDLIDFAAQLPIKLKVKGTKLRYLFKESLRGFLPNETLTKSKHGFGLPFGPWMKSYKPLHEIAHDSLQSLKKRDIIRTGFIDELVNEHMADHAGYYGSMVWTLMMLEQWFQHHHDE